MAPQATNPTPRLAYTLHIITSVLIIGIVLLIGFLVWPFLFAQLQERMSGAPALPQPTALVVRPPAQPIVRPIVAPGIAQNEATAQAMYNAAVSEAAPVPNVDTTGDIAPPVLISKPADRQPAPDVVPTAEPRTESGGIFGSKPAVVNPQETHECKHGQVWTARGCKNPTPTR